jgi:hypothetical protein
VMILFDTNGCRDELNAVRAHSEHAAAQSAARSGGACLGAGKSAREAGLDAGYKDGSGLKGNISRLRRTAVMRERFTSCL